MTRVKSHPRVTKTGKIVNVKTHERKYKIQDIMKYYENMKVKVNGKWYFMDLDKLKGVEVKGKLVKKRTREWLE